MRSWIRSTAVLVFVAYGLGTAAFAQGNYPTRPIRMIVPFPPGGGTDILSRLVANKLTETLGWQIVVDNRAGAGGNIGLDAGAKATPDGYTMVMGQTSNLTINPSRLGTEITRVLEAPEVRERMAANGGATIKPGPAAFDAQLKSELAKWSRIIKEAGVKIE